jgi:hypothetical protein
LQRSSLHIFIACQRRIGLAKLFDASTHDLSA